MLCLKKLNFQLASDGQSSNLHSRHSSLNDLLECTAKFRTIVRINAIKSSVMTAITIDTASAVTADSTTATAVIASNFGAKTTPKLISYQIIQYVVATSTQIAAAIIIAVLVVLLLCLTVTAIINSKELAR